MFWLPTAPKSQPGTLKAQLGQAKLSSVSMACMWTVMINCRWLLMQLVRVALSFALARPEIVGPPGWQ